MNFLARQSRKVPGDLVITAAAHWGLNEALEDAAVCFYAEGDFASAF